jgi:hypothetical protein
MQLVWKISQWFQKLWETVGWRVVLFVQLDLLLQHYWDLQVVVHD